jgi:sugar transferase (PEP-CTERM/EpsH1 system associated)
MRLFILLSRVPYPLEKGDKLRAFHQIKELAKNNTIHLCALNDSSTIHPETYTILNDFCETIDIIQLPKWQIYSRLAFAYIFTEKPLQVSYFYSHKTQNKINKLIDKYKPDHIYCQLARVAEYVKNCRIPKTLDYMDALARGMERRIDKEPFYLKPFLKSETVRLKRYEREIFDYFNNATIISEQDRDLIVHLKNECIYVIPNGVDYSKFKINTVAEKNFDIIFSGNMAYPPNIDSAEYLINKIMPLVWQKHPNIKVVLAGANPVKRVLQLASDKVTVTGWVDDISEIYATSRIFVAPMQIGTGLQNKLLEAMAMKIPCITSPLANNALQAIPGRDILIGNTPQEYAQYIIQLLNDNVLAEKIAENGHQFIKEKYTWEGSTKVLQKIFENKISPDC